MISHLNPQLDEKHLRSAAHVVYHASEGIVQNLINSRETEISTRKKSCKKSLDLLAVFANSQVKSLLRNPAWLAGGIIAGATNTNWLDAHGIDLARPAPA